MQGQTQNAKYERLTLGEIVKCLSTSKQIIMTFYLEQ